MTDEKPIKHRIQLDFSANAYKRLEGLVKESGLLTKAETIRNAIRLYEWALLRKDEGYELGSIKENPDGTYTQRILEVF